jgi:hypothetical protein
MNGTATATATQQHFAGNYRQSEQKDKAQIDQNKSATTIFAGDIRESPQVAQTNSTTYRG